MTEEHGGDSDVVLIDNDGTPITTLGHAERVLQRLKDEVTDIGMQLASRNKSGPDGERLRGQEYWEWRNKAHGALAYRTKEMRAVKALIHKLHLQERRDQIAQGHQRETTARQLLYIAYPYLRRLPQGGDPTLTALLLAIPGVFEAGTTWPDDE